MQVWNCRRAAAVLLFAVCAPYAVAQQDDPRATAAALIDNGQPVEACAVLEKAYGAKTVENDVLLMQAHCSWRAGRAEAAIDYYRKLIERLPNAARPRAELGMLYLQLGRQAEAQTAFDAAEALDPNATVSALGVLARAMANEDPSALARAIRKNWQIELYTGLVYDSNINSGPNGTTIAAVIGGVPVDLILGEESQPTHSWGSSSHLTARYLHSINRNFGLLAQGSIAKTFYFSDNEFDNDSSAAALGLLYRDGAFNASLQPSFRISRQSNRTVDRTYGLNGRISQGVAHGVRLTAGAGYFKRDTPDNRARKAEGYLASFGVVGDVMPGLQLGAEYMLQTEDAREDFESRDSNGPVIYATWAAHPTLTLSGSYRYSKVEYDERQGIFPEARSDRQHVLDLSALWDVSKYVYPGTAVRVQHTYIRGESNLALYDTRRRITTVGMQVLF